MALKDKITTSEEEAIMRYVHWYASYNSKLGLDEVLHYWESEKGILAKAFGGNLILSKSVNFQLGIDELMDAIEDTLFCSYSDAQIFIHAFNSLTACGGIYAYNYNLGYLMHADTLAKNIYEGDDFSIVLPSGKTLAINHGCKVSKVLGKIANELNLPGYENFRILHSQALNQKKLKGTLCLSIHPLDYMTMSDNDCGWDSCMSWVETGEYRRGTVEMMNSQYVVVAYLTAEDPYSIGSLEWSNKKWRELFVVAPNIITGVKPYPYCNEYLEEIACTWLRDLVEENLGWHYFNDLAKYSHRNSFNFHNNNYVVDFDTDAMYNDFGTRSSHMGYIGVNAPNNIYYNYSGIAQCMCCGRVDNFETEQELICCDCDDHAHCCECGDSCEKDYMYELDGNLYCEYCYNHVSQECEICEENHHSDTCYDVNLARKCPENDGKIEIITNAKISICGECKYALQDSTSEITKKFLKPGAKMDIYSEYWHYYCLLYIDDCTEEGLRLFGYDNVEELEEGIEDTLVVYRPN